ncbi:branched-subunit amino acid transport protein AzlD [Breznakia sp. PF5-3]|uniref:branched-chain amino acid transporter permease n=1 Tax=unclassified Breznakia TaxID=2623764 RepID=UPI002406E73E|nr:MULTISPECIES: branched-chain amino acid transporter permease [unclassified Breznakia]MDL2276208.1 branched-chain amino acid transporter permease [Breznakia sp. OttesenSCG-928-G09]MDF9824729.1 branched-subunit amino acid transport protein AzlD [Breznakia sp. PM6-1]MDF9835392.1 branched-subunit amino acid transport protein AzlD [Breznakia sp. PF5-3]MDF9836991.1 branched-subunit amino acid transport protein AzlD [Breznakia sp. PFB2-8]MDF9859627.1 branched-subunit amino acid transport protein A
MNDDALLIVCICGVITLFSRMIPFLVFPEGRKTPAIILYLSDYLPVAMIGMLIIYCLKDVDFLSTYHGFPELLGITIVAVLHLWKRNTLLSIVGGTVCYMFLLQVVCI